MDQVFPGSKTPLVAPPEPETDDADQWDTKPHIFSLRGVETEFFTIGQLAQALGNRQASTIRKWENEGVLPKSMYNKPSHDPRGRRRMYSRAMVEGLMEIAREEGVFWPQKGLRLSQTQFTVKAVSLFKRLQS